MQYQTLASLPLEQKAYIEQLNLNGELHRRLLELGFFAGNQVIPLFRSPLGDPTAYMVMDSVVALRKEDAGQIFIHLCKKEEV